MQRQDCQLGGEVPLALHRSATRLVSKLQAWKDVIFLCCGALSFFSERSDSSEFFCFAGAEWSEESLLGVYPYWRAL